MKKLMKKQQQMIYKQMIKNIDLVMLFGFAIEKAAKIIYISKHAVKMTSLSH